MPLSPTLTVTQLQGNYVAAWASALNPAFGITPANIPAGDPILALGFATAGTATYLQAWMQGLVDYSRASTAVGPELDSWMADFNFVRPGGGFAQGWISVPTPTGKAATTAVPIPNLTVFQTAPIVVSPSTIPTVYYFTTQSAATIAVGQTSVLIPFKANAAGAIYNGVPASSALQFSSGIAGTGNPSFALAPGQASGSAAPAGGTNADSDPAARAAFVNYIDSLAGSIESSLVAGIEEVSSYLQNGSTFVVWDFASQPNGVQLAFPGQAVCVFVSPNPSNSGQYLGPLGTDPIADGILTAMNGTVANPIDAVAFTVTPIVYYANSYLITTLAFAANSIWVSQSALNAAGLSYTQLQSSIQGALQALVGNPNGIGLGISVGLAWSAIINTMRNFSVTQASGAVVSNIITDVLPSAMTGIVTGPVTQHYAGPWVSGATYSVNQIVIYLGNSYRNTTGSNTGNPVSDSTDWTEVLVPANISYASASDGGMVPSATHQGTIEGTGDPSGVLRWASSLSVSGAGWTTPNYVP